jgi:hypothetical protein
MKILTAEILSRAHKNGSLPGSFSLYRPDACRDGLAVDLVDGGA